MTVPMMIAVVENHPLFRHALTGMVEDAPDLDLACAVCSVPELLTWLDATDGEPRRADVVLLDLHLAGKGPQGADAVIEMRRRKLTVLVVSANGSRPTVLAAMSAGANGYVSKDAESGEILDAIRAVAAGTSYISATLASYLLDDAHEIKLTRRESEILRLVARGDTDLDIAEELDVKVSTVRGHLDRIRDKTGHRRRPHLIWFALRRGLLPRGERTPGKGHTSR
jgi:DNA-binding NarL/FixJ family response regulator